MTTVECIVDDFRRILGDVLHLYDVRLVDQNTLKEELVEHDTRFPMICFEKTPDSPFDVEYDESKFLNDELHEGNWVVISKHFEPLCVMNLIEKDYKLEIDVFEIGKEYRNNGYGKHIINILEMGSKLNGIDVIHVRPFDTGAREFWEHLGYIDENKDDTLYKKLVEQDN